MSEDIYRKVQRQLNGYSLGFPETQSGVEIKILKFLFSEEEALLFSQMSDTMETPDTVARRIGRPQPEVAERLEKMAHNGLLYRTRKEDLVKYCAAPFIHGLLEFQARAMPKELVDLTGQYVKEKLKDNMAGKSGMRVLPVRESVDMQHQIASYDDAYEILRNQALIVVADCACRLQRKQFDRACDAPLETCIMVGHMAEYYIENKMGRRIDLDEAMRVIAECRAAGLVTQTPSINHPIMICNCCKCCCGFLGAIRRTSHPAELVFSNHLCHVASAACSGCAACIEKCPVKAISMNDQDLAEINHERCIGCGLCIPACPEEAMMLIAKPEELHSKPGEIKSAFTFYDFEV